MTNKDIASGLLKIANILDNMGLISEATNLDKVARRIVVSENPEIKRLHFGEAQSLVVSGVYSTDIQNYKRLYYSAYYDAMGNYNKDMYTKYLDLAKNFYSRAMKTYTGTTKRAFELQAERIREDIKGDFKDINVELFHTGDKPLNYYLKKYQLVDDYGDRLLTVNNINTFNARWNNLLKDPYISRNMNDDYLASQLNTTKLLLKEGIPKQQGQ